MRSWTSRPTLGKAEWVKAGTIFLVGLGILAVLDAREVRAQERRKATVTRDIGRIGSRIDFFRVSDATFDGGLVWVLEAARARAFGPEGRVLRSVGRQGSGPGEFQWAAHLGFIGDTLWVADVRLRRVTMFPPDEGPETIALNRDSWGPTGHRISAAVPMDGGLMVGLGTTRPDVAATGLVDSAPVLLIDREGFVSDTLTSVSVREQDGGRTPETDRRGSYTFTQPISDRPLVDARSESGRVLVVERRLAEEGPGAARLRVFDLRGGDADLDVMVELDPVQVPERVYKDWVQAHLDSDLGRFAEIARAELEDAMFDPELAPSVSQARLDLDGRVWLARYSFDDDDDIEWVVLGPDGRPEFRVDLPWGSSVLDATGDRVLIRRAGAAGEEVISELRISR